MVISVVRLVIRFIDLSTTQTKTIHEITRIQAHSHQSSFASFRVVSWIVTFVAPLTEWSYNAGTRAIAMLLFAAEHTREALKSN